MPFERFKGIIETFPSLERVEIGGGEPLLNPALPGMVAHALSKKLRTDISTNCRIYPELIVRMDAGELLSLQVNLPAGGEAEYDRITRTSGGFPIVMENIKLLATSGLKTRLRLTICKENAAQLEPVYHIAKALKLPLIVAPAIPVDGLEILGRDEMDDLFLRALLLRMAYKRMDFLWSYHETSCPEVAKAYGVALKPLACTSFNGEKMYADNAGNMKGCEFHA